MSGPGFMTREVFTYLSLEEQSRLFIAPKHFFYPLSNDIRDKITPDTYIELTESSAVSKRDEVFGCHMWESNWVI